jgi:tetratricopeptide (TPR) repeat protein
VGKKNPSSLDYETLLHELSLKNWRLSILDADFPRAIQNAGQLARSRDRFWRWQGYLDLAVAHLCQGRSESSREALEGAKNCFREVPGLRAPAFEIEAHIWLETGKPHGAIECARRAGIETPLLSYLRGLGHARLEDRASADSEALALSRRGGLGAVLSSHVTAESHPEKAVETLADAVGRLRGDERDPSSAGVLLRFALGSALFARSELERALSELEEVLREEESLLYWPIPTVRALFLRASADARKFLSYWDGGDLDRERLEEARQLVKA